MNMATGAAASAGLFHAHIPLHESANLALGITAPHHSRDKLAVLLFGIAVLFRTERDHRKQVLDLGEYPLFDDFANLFIAGPGRVLVKGRSVRSGGNVLTTLSCSASCI